MAFRLLAIADSGCPVSTRERVAKFDGHLSSKDIQLQVVDWPRRGAGRAAAVAKLLNHVADANAVVIQRYLPDSAALREVRKRARRLTFDFDDAIVYSDSTRGKPHLKLRRAWRFRKMMQCCDAVTAGNEYLADLARKYGAANLLTVPTTLDVAEYESAQAPSLASSDSKNGPAIGWIGLPATMPYLRRLRRPLEQLQREIPDLQIRIISFGMLDFGPLQVDAVPWAAQTEVVALKGLHVGLAPLLDDAWTRGKCARRLTQYMAAGVPAVASPVGAQAEIIDRGAALPARSDTEWVDAVRKILADKHFAAQLSDRAKQLVRERFDAAKWAEPLRAIWCGTE